MKLLVSSDLCCPLGIQICSVGRYLAACVCSLAWASQQPMFSLILAGLSPYPSSPPPSPPSLHPPPSVSVSIFTSVCSNGFHEKPALPPETMAVL